MPASLLPGAGLSACGRVVPFPGLRHNTGRLKRGIPVFQTAFQVSCFQKQLFPKTNAVQMPLIYLYVESAWL
jgi:hypothetical protein